MISFLNRYRKALFISTTAVFLLGTFVGLGGYLFTSRDMGQAVASVGSTKIPYMRFLARVNQYADSARNRNGEVTEAQLKAIKVEMMRGMIVDELLLVKADELGIVVTDEELARDVRGTPAFQSGGEFNPQAYAQALRTMLHDTPQGYEETRRRAIKSGRLKQLIYQAAKISPDELEEFYAKEHKGKLKDYQKEKDAFAGRVRQARALDLINFLLRQLSGQVEVRTYLDQRERGV